jgi:hypothetical protein
MLFLLFFFIVIAHNFSPRCEGVLLKSAAKVRQIFQTTMILIRHRWKKIVQNFRSAQLLT